MEPAAALPNPTKPKIEYWQPFEVLFTLTLFSGLMRPGKVMEVKSPPIVGPVAQCNISNVSDKVMNLKNGFIEWIAP